MGRSYTYAVTSTGHDSEGGWWVIAPPAAGAFDGIAHYSAALAEAINAIEPAQLISPASWAAFHQSHAERARSSAVKGILLQYSPPAFVKADLPKLLSILAHVRGRGLPVVTTVHEYWPPPSASIKRTVWRWLCRRALLAVAARSSQLAVTTPYAGRFLAESGIRPAAGAVVIPVGTNIPATPRACSGSEGKPLTIAMFGQPAGLDPAVVLALAKWVEARSPRPRLVWNAHSIDQMRTWWQQLGAPDVVEFHGGQPSGDVADLLGEADLAVGPYIDGASTRRSTLAAFVAGGLPIVALDGRYTDDRLRQSGALLLSPIGNAPAFIANLNRLAGDAALRAEMSAASRRLQANDLAWPRIAEQQLEAARK